jgi:hypothetical protein
MPTAASLCPATSSVTTAIPGIGYNLPWMLMGIGAKDNFLGATTSGSPIKGGIFGGGGGSNGSGANNGGIFGGGGGADSSAQAGGAGGLGGGGGGGAGTGAAQAAGGAGGSGYVFVVAMENL